MLAQTPTASAVTTIGELWQRAADAGRTRPAFLVEKDGVWSPVSWDEATERVAALANGFLSLGVEKGDKVAILCRTRLEWSLTDYALSTIGAIVIPIYPTSSPSEIAYILRDSETKLLLSEDEEQLAKTRDLEGELPSLERVIGIDAPGGGGTLDDVAEAGRAWGPSNPEALARAAAQVGPDDVLTFLYTSGTTGNPKGCLLSHRNYVAMTDAVVAMSGLFRDDDTALLFLPLAHNFARLIQFTAAAVGFPLALCPDVRGVSAALAAVRPTLFPSVPRVYEKVHTAVKAAAAESGGVKSRLAEWAFAVGERIARGDSGAVLALQHRIADRLVLAQGAGAHGRPDALRRLGRRAARARDRTVLRRVRGHDPRGLRDDRVHDRGDVQPARRAALRDGGPRAARDRAEDRHGRRDPDPRRDGLRRLLPKSRGDGGDADVGRLAAQRRHRHDRRRTAT